MKPLATYYKLVDRDTEKVGAKWKGKNMVKTWKTQVGALTCSLTLYVFKLTQTSS